MPDDHDDFIQRTDDALAKLIAEIQEDGPAELGHVQITRAEDAADTEIRVNDELLDVGPLASAYMAFVYLANCCEEPFHATEHYAAIFGDYEAFHVVVPEA